MPLPFLGRKLTLSEAEEEEALLDKEISIKQKRAVLAKLNENGLTLKTFGGSVKAALNWLKATRGKSGN
jgi:hypothetical protein